MSTPRAAPLALVLLLAACHSPGRGDAPARTGASPAVAGAVDAPRPPRPADTVILGEATYRERIKMPPGASLTVDLVALDAASPRVVARARMPDVAGPPIPFALAYEATRVPAHGRYALRAELLGPDGARWFATPAPVPVVPGQGTAVELPLHRTGTAASADVTTPAPGPRHWECGELGVMSRKADGGRGLRLDADGRAWILRAAGASPAGRFAAPGGTAFESDGATARLTLDGEPARECVVARQASPWNAALLRGVAFRAVGNEPGWHVEVGGEPPMLRATLDYGERRIDIPATRAGDGWLGTAGDEPVALEARRTPCTDGMSGQRFEATVTLRVGERTYQGCGARLDD